MAINSTLPVAVGTEVFANDEVAAVKYPRGKVVWGPAGTVNDADVASGKPLPTQLRHSGGTELADATGIKISTASQNANGQATMLLSAPVVLAKNQFGSGEYETVAASQTAQALGATGATGDFISGVLVIPATTSPGVVTLLDNAISIPLFVGGATSVSNLVPFFIPLGMISVSGAWKITTGANVSCVAVGDFT